MQSVIAVIIIELNYLLRVLGKHWLWFRTGGSLCLTDAVGGAGLMRGVEFGLHLKPGMCYPTCVAEVALVIVLKIALDGNLHGSCFFQMRSSSVMWQFGKIPKIVCICFLSRRRTKAGQLDGYSPGLHMGSARPLQANNLSGLITAVDEDGR